MNTYKLFKALFFVSFLLVIPVCAEAQWTVLTSKYSNITLEDIHAKGDTIIAVGTEIATYDGFILTSFDGGTTWKVDTTVNGYFLKGISFSDDNTGTIAALGSIGCTMRTVDGGYSWTWNWCESNLQYKGVYDIGFTSSSIGYMAGYGDNQFFDGNIYKSTDAGQSWNSITGLMPGRPFEFIHFADDKVFYGGSYLFGHSLLYRSIDGGVNWKSLDVTKECIGAVHFKDEATGFLAGCDGAIYKTIDSANTWTQVGQKFNNTIFTDITFINDLTGHAVGNSGVILKTEDGGQTWEIDNVGIPNTNFVRVRAFGNKAYAVSDDGVVVVSPPAQVISGVKKKSLNESTALIPNPFSNSASLKIPAHFKEPFTMDFFDANGRKVDFKYFIIRENEVEVQNLKNRDGIYFYQLKSGNGMFSNGRFMLN